MCEWERGKGSSRESERMLGVSTSCSPTHTNRSRSNQTLLGLEVLIACKGAHGTHKGSRHAEDACLVKQTLYIPKLLLCT